MRHPPSWTNSYPYCSPVGAIRKYFRPWGFFWGSITGPAGSSALSGLGSSGVGCFPGRRSLRLACPGLLHPGPSGLNCRHLPLATTHHPPSTYHLPSTTYHLPPTTYPPRPSLPAPRPSLLASRPSPLASRPSPPAPRSTLHHPPPTTHHPPPTNHIFSDFSLDIVTK